MLEPDKDGYVMNYAAVLIGEHRNSQESVKLTRRQLEQFPNNPDLQINHALALIQTKRPDEAEKILKAVNPNRLKTTEASVFNYAWAELHLQRNDGSKARKSYSLVNTNHIMPPQVTWMESRLKEL
jgi:predicted Zn-dependent protease